MAAKPYRVIRHSRHHGCEMDTVSTTAGTALNSMLFISLQMLVNIDLASGSSRLASQRGDLQPTLVSTLPPNPAAFKIAHRNALIPKYCADPGATLVSALHAMISPSAPGPSTRPSGWTMGLRSCKVFCREAMLASDAAVFFFLFLTRSLSALERTIWCGMACWRKRARRVRSVSLMLWSVSIRMKARRSLSSILLLASFYTNMGTCCLLLTASSLASTS